MASSRESILQVVLLTNNLKPCVQCTDGPGPHLQCRPTDDVTDRPTEETVHQTEGVTLTSNIRFITVGTPVQCTDE